MSADTKHRSKPVEAFAVSVLDRGSGDEEKAHDGADDSLFAASADAFACFTGCSSLGIFPVS
jgi:hypothetical protein